MVFNISSQWIEEVHNWSCMDERVDCIHQYLYLSVVFAGPIFAMRVVHAQLTRGHAAHIRGLRRMCSKTHANSYVLWLFDTLVTPSILYGVQN